MAACLSITCFGANASNDSKTSVWKVSKDGDSVYIGGAVHILPITEFPLPEQFSDVYNETNSLVFEAKMPEPTDMKTQQLIMSMMSYKNGKTLKDVLSAETIKSLDAYLAEFGGNFEQISTLKPGLVTVIISAMEAQRQQMAGEGVDSYFMQMGRNDKKAVEYLETIEQQGELLANLWQGNEDHVIKSTLRDMKDLKPYLRKLIDAWRVGDEDAINELAVMKLKNESVQVYEKLFLERNEQWIPKIEAMFGDEDKEFVVVGVGHLVGDNSVIAKLQKKGYTVTKV